MVDTVGDALPREMARVRDVVMPAYREIGPAGAIGLEMMRRSLDEAATAMAAGDAITMIRALQDLRSYKA